MSDSSDSASASCPRCGGERSPGPLGWSCPACLLDAALSGIQEAPPGARRFGPYEIVDELGRGGMGVVYRAWEAGLDRVVAVKLLLGGAYAGDDFLRRFRQEARLAARLNHAGIVTVYDAGEEDGQAFYAMELIEGRTLADRLRDGTLPARDAAALVEKIARAVEHAHSLDVLHRDLKPSNILIDPAGEPKVADFGLARSWHEGTEMTLSSGTLGSPPYMSPEQAAGRRTEIGPVTDVYGLGALLYHSLTGRPPHQGASPEETLVHVRDVEVIAPRLLNPSLPRDLETICLKALEKDPARRYQTALALAEDLARFLRDEPVLARPVGTLGRTARWARRNRRLAVVLALLAVTLAAGVSATLWQGRQAVQHAAEAEEERYVSDVFAAGLAYRAGDWPRARELLAAWIPGESAADRRGMEWRLLWHRLRTTDARIVDIRSITVTCIAFSPDGKVLAVADQSGRIEFRDAESGQNVREKPPENAAGLKLPENAAGLSVRFINAPGAEPLIACGPQAGGKFDFFSAADGKRVWTLPCMQAAAAADAPRILTCHGVRYHWTRRGGDAEVWDTASRQRLLHIPGRWRGAAISNDGRKLALTGESGGIRLVNADTGTSEDWPTAHPVWEPAFSSDGRRLAAAGHSHVFVWDLDAPRLPPVVLPHSGAVWSIVFIPGEPRLVTACSDRCARVWNCDGGLERLLPGHASEVWTVAVSPHSHRLATGGKDCTARIWEEDRGWRDYKFPSQMAQSPVFDDQNRILTGNKGEARWIEPRSGASESAGKIPEDDPSSIGQTWTDYGQITARADTNGVISVTERSSGSTWTIQGPPRKGRYAITADAARRRLAVCAEPETGVRLIELDTKREMMLKGRPESIYYFTGVAFSPDGEMLAGADLAGPIHLWRVSDGKWLGALAGHPQESSGVAFSPDGRTLASIGVHQSVKFWHLATRRELITLDYPRAMSGIGISPDGKWLALTLGDEWTEEIEVLEAPESD